MGEATNTHAADAQQAAAASSQASPLPAEIGALSSSLEPHVRRETGGRLGAVEWFRAAWQRSEASTGFASYSMDDGTEVPVVVKLPVSYTEYRWSTCLGKLGEPRWEDRTADTCPVPRMIDGGDAINGYDLCWLVEERLEREGSRAALTKEDVEGVLNAAAEVQAAAHEAARVTEPPKPKDWESLVAQSREALDSVFIPQPQHWNAVLKKFHKIVPAVARAWEARPTMCWCHGDLHMGNAMQRTPGGRWVLLDLALMHPGHWVEDAVYFERQYWHRKDDLQGIKPVSAMARARKRLDLPMPGDHAELANLRRALMASCVPAAARHEGSAAYCDAALALLERLIPVLPHH